MTAIRHLRPIRLALGWGVLSVMLLAVAGMLALKPAYRYSRDAWYAWTAQTSWQSYLESNTPEEAPGLPAAWLSIPSVGLEELVLRGADEQTLMRRPGSVWEGDRIRVLTAHRDRQFRALADLREGDRVDLETAAGRQSYRVSSIEVMEKDGFEETLKASLAETEIALTSCYPFVYVGPAPKRFLAIARRVP